MTESIWDGFENVVVAVGLDDHAAGLVAAGAAIAARTGKPLHVVHVVEPWHTRLAGRPLEPASPLWSAARAVEHNATAIASERLSQMAARHATELKVRTHVVVGKPATEIARMALDLNAALLVVGARLGDTAPRIAGLSTALTLMETSPVPVLVADARHAPVFPEHPLKILVADDLADDTEDAIAFAAAFAAAWRGAWVHHVHVNPLDRETLTDALQTATAAARTNAGSTVADVYDAYLETQGRCLLARADDQRPYVEAAGGTYTTELATGSVRPQISEVFAVMHPDILVFGRHRAVHREPFFFGRMPVRAMLAHGKPVLVVPERGR